MGTAWYAMQAPAHGSSFEQVTRPSPCRNGQGVFCFWGAVVRTKEIVLLLFLAILLTAGPTVPARAAGNGARLAGDVSDEVLRSAAHRAVEWLRTQQHDDGGFGTSDKTSPGLTADVAYALALMGESITGTAWTTQAGKTPIDALRATAVPGYATADPGQAGKVARAVALACAGPHKFGGVDLIATINGFYQPETGLYHSSYLFRHTFAIEGLARSGDAVPQPAYDALLANQIADGVWFWSVGAATSDVDATGRILQVLAKLGGVKADQAYGKAAAYLAAQQLPGGGWHTGYTPDPENPPSANANSTALAVGGLAAAGYDPQSTQFTKNGKGALETLLSFQEPSGAFVYIREPGKEDYRIVATTDALIALASLVGVPNECKSLYLPLILVG